VFQGSLCVPHVSHIVGMLTSEFDPVFCRKKHSGGATSLMRVCRLLRATGTISDKWGPPHTLRAAHCDAADQCALNLSRKHQPKPNLHTEVRRNRTEVLETRTDEYQTLVQGLIKGCREWNRCRKRGESIVFFVEVLGTKSKYLSLVLSEPEWNRNRQES
jgi:hypothetical protein